MGSERMDLLLPLLRGKRVGLMVNQSSVVGPRQTHLLDTLLSQGVSVRKVFVPEHGFRGNVDAGKRVRSDIDDKTGLPIVSLYGKHKRPTKAMLEDVDVLLFDIQDVGLRFYTYISSMHYLMDAAAEYGQEVVVADRPNPNDFIDGPILESDCRSFVGIHPIPIAHGLTVGELARMINGEGWLTSGKRQCKLSVIPITGWTHGQPYALPIPPSPNLPNSKSIELYPSLCIFEATIMSVGRGTDLPFRSVAYPHKAFGKYLYTPEPRRGADLNPKHKGRKCYGLDLRQHTMARGTIDLSLLVHYYNVARQQGLELVNQNQMFSLLMGNKRILPMLRSGKSAEEIRATWLPALEPYKLKRSQYLLYPDYKQ
ncbi:MAG: DUF1343 domain-containing protein [Porphyromonas sp.]|nr:DUF1343 domain-containing protein [Porphyromonas sp.]